LVLRKSIEIEFRELLFINGSMTGLMDRANSKRQLGLGDGHWMIFCTLQAMFGPQWHYRTANFSCGTNTN
jgi:hypothetical protein